MVVIENNSAKFKKCAMALAVASSLSLATSFAEAAGLGKLTVFSSLGQPLKAEVEIAASSEELLGMTARMAPPDVFKQAGVDYVSALNDLQFKVEKRRNGKSVLRLSSVHPVNEPFLDFLVELTWPAGRLVREYTFLLDPPEFAAAQQRNSVDAKVVETVRGAAATPKPAPQSAAAEKPRMEARPAASAAKVDGDKTREVAAGETLIKIARERRYASVSLEQMLVGLYRANGDAFIGKDINRLKSGVILNVPDENAVAAISQKEARAVYVSAGDFAAYKRKLAAASVAAPAKDDATPGQSSAGKITPKIEEKTPAVDASRDQVKVSRADAPSAAMIDRVASEKAMQEAQSRLAQLERNITELQKLLELKNQRLAELEKPAVAAPPVPAPAPVATPTPPTPPTPEPAAATPAPAEAAADGAPRVAETTAPVEEKPAEPPAPVEPPPAPPKPVEPPPPSVEEPSDLEGMLPLLGGAAAIVLLGGGLLYSRRRKKAAPTTQVTAVPAPSSIGPNSVFGMTGGQSVDTGSAPPHTGDFSQAGPGTIDTDEVDPVAEADVYMAYGRDAQAEEILLEAMQKDPSRLAIHVKLLEIYAGRRSVKQFETLATELYAVCGGQGLEWEKAAALGASIDPGNPLYGAGAQDGSGAKDSGFDPDATLVASPAAIAAATAAAAALAQTAVEEPESIAEISEPEPLAMDVEPPAAPEPMLESLSAVEASPEESDEMSLDFDLGDASPEAPAAAAELPPVVEEPYVDTVVTGENAADALDFDLSGLVAGEEAATAAEGAAAKDVAAEAGDEVVDFDLIDLPDNGDAMEFGDAAAAPDFSPEGTLVISNAGLGQSANTDFSFDAVRALEPAPAEELAGKLDAVAQDVADAAADEIEIDNPGLTSTVVNALDHASGDMDFDVKLSDSVFLGQPMMNPEFDMDAINLDLSTPPAEAPAADVPVESAPEVAPEKDALWEEVNTKLDLAKAYEEMGDLEGARELLQEVVNEGSADLVAQAQDILGRIGG